MRIRRLRAGGMKCRMPGDRWSSFANIRDLETIENPGKDDFELWSPSEDRPEQCLFGTQV